MADFASGLDQSQRRTGGLHFVFKFFSFHLVNPTDSGYKLCLLLPFQPFLFFFGWLEGWE
jgi:hypothetical protein